MMSVTAPQRLDFVALRLRARALQPFALENPYSDLHGGFGLMLHAHLRPIYEDLFGAQQDSADVRGYVLRPGNGLNGRVEAGGDFDIELVLVGPASRHAASCLEALAMLGVNGLTQARHRFEITEIQACHPQGEQTVWSADVGWNVKALAPQPAAELLADRTNATSVLIDFTTPLRLKKGDGFLHTCPTPRIFIERLLGRMQLLATQQTGVPLLTRELKISLLAQAEGVRVVQDTLEWVRLERYSARQKQRMENGGLLGLMLFEGALGELEGWMRLGSWLHVGAKTTFGLGRYRMNVLAS